MTKDRRIALYRVSCPALNEPHGDLVEAIRADSAAERWAMSRDDAYDAPFLAAGRKNKSIRVGVRGPDGAETCWEVEAESVFDYIATEAT